MKTELLAPAGSYEALVAAISNGADAIYLGMKTFGARAYASNFDNELLEKAIEYAHLRNVKIYVTMNTIIFDSELDAAYKQIDDLYKLGVDGLIIQDLATFTRVTENYPLMEAHCSTQMGIDDLDGTLLFKELGAKRVVLSREVPFEKIKSIKNEAKIPIEIFCHGALCVSYSGNCLMSGLIGYRSGNRGRCVGSCRKPYKLINTTTGEELTNSYILSMKDLNTYENIKKLGEVADSLKIEGRMKEPVYVANVINSYRKRLDGQDTEDTRIALNKTFNRTYTKGYIFGEDKKNITNILRPNNYGYYIGKVTRKTKGLYEITLNESLLQGDIIRIDHNDEDVIVSTSKMYDNNGNFINSSYKFNNKELCYIKIKEELSIGDSVYKTKDLKFTEEIEKSYPREFKRLPLNVYAYGEVGSPLVLTLEYDNTSITLESDFNLDKAEKNPATLESFTKQFDRLNDTVYKLNEVSFNVEGAFIPSSKLNELRRQAIEKLNNERIGKREAVTITQKVYDKITFDSSSPKLSVYCNTEAQYKAAKELGIDIIYYKDNVVRRNQIEYKKTDKELLLGGYGGIHYYKDTNSFVTDFSLNVVNFEAVYNLHKLGAKRVTLSYEINQDQINDLVNDYNKNVGGNPNLEMIVYGHSHMLFTNYCPLKVMGQCGKCKENRYMLSDEHGDFPIINHDDCTNTIINGKILNLIDELENINGVNVYRVNLTIEDYNESIEIIKKFKNKLNTMSKTNFFNKDTDTRGHFNKEIL